MIIWGVLLGLFVLILLVVLHELGHAIVAKRNGVKVEEFGVGFPPAAKKWKVKRSFLGEDEDSVGWCRDELDNCDCFVHDSCGNWNAENPVEPSPIAI